MTDSTLPLRDADAALIDEDAGARRPLLLAGGLVAALVLGTGGYLLLGGGGAQSDVVVTVPAALGVSRASGTTSGTRPAAAAQAVSVPFEEALGRDPFRALYVEPAAVAGPAAADPTLPGPAGTSGGSTVVAPAVAEPAAAPLAAPVPAAPAVGPAPAAVPLDGAPAVPTAQEHRLVLLGASGSDTSLSARLTVDGKPYAVKPGDHFGPLQEIRLISVQQGPGASQWTAVLQVGDGSPFDAVSGQALLVR